MTAPELEQLISQEIRENKIVNWHGITKENIKRHLLNPCLKEFVTAWNGQSKKYWLVLDEDPGNQVEGYLIIYDQEENMFGLALKVDMNRTDMGIVIGLYGTFIITLNGM